MLKLLFTLYGTGNNIIAWLNETRWLIQGNKTHAFLQVHLMIMSGSAWSMIDVFNAIPKIWPVVDWTLSSTLRDFNGQIYMTIVSPQNSLVLNHICHRQQYIYVPAGEITIFWDSVPKKQRLKFERGKSPYKPTINVTNNLILKICSSHENSKL